MIGPQPRTSHRKKRKTKEGGVKKQLEKRKNILAQTTCGASFQCTGCREIGGLRHEVEKGGEEEKMTCHANAQLGGAVCIYDIINDCSI